MNYIAANSKKAIGHRTIKSTALQIAMGRRKFKKEENIEIAKLLLQHGANPNKMVLRGERDVGDEQQSIFKVMSKSMPDMELAKYLIQAGLEMSYISKIDLFNVMDKVSEIETLELLALLAEKGYDF